MQSTIMRRRRNAEHRGDDRLDLLAPKLEEIVCDRESRHIRQDDLSTSQGEELSPTRTYAFFGGLKNLLGFGGTERQRADSEDTFYSAKSSFSNSMVSECSCEQSCERSDDSCASEDSYIMVPVFPSERYNGTIGDFGPYSEYRECQQQQELANQIKDIVETSVSCKILISDSLALKTACSIMNIAKSEPYGLKGCKVIVLIDDATAKHFLGSLCPEEGVVSTFEVTLALHLRKGHRRMKVFGWRKRALQVADQFELRKEKLYMSKKRSPSFIS